MWACRTSRLLRLSGTTCGIFERKPRAQPRPGLPLQTLMKRRLSLAARAWTSFGDGLDLLARDWNSWRRWLRLLGGGLGLLGEGLDFLAWTSWRGLGLFGPTGRYELRLSARAWTSGNLFWGVDPQKGVVSCVFRGALSRRGLGLLGGDGFVRFHSGLMRFALRLLQAFEDHGCAALSL